MRALVATAVRRRVTVVMVALAITAFGLVGYQRLALELFPDISYPSITVQTEFPDTAPEEVETLVTRPVEEAVGVLRGLREIHSVSRSGVSEVTLNFDWNTDMDMLSMDVREKLDRLVLPEEAEDPIVLRYDPSLDPIVRLALSGSDDLAALRRLADKQLKQDLESIPGVASAAVKGGLEDEIQINVDQERLAALSIPLSRVAQTVGVSNVNLPGGSLRGAQNHYLIRTINEFDSVDEIANLIVYRGESGVVRLGDVAEVKRGTKEREEITRVDGKESVEIDIFKEGDANTVELARRLHKRIDEWNTSKLPKNYKLTKLFDQSEFIKQAVDEVRSAAVIGGILAVLVLLAFLRDWRSTLVIATSIPLSVVAAFLLMYRADITLNVMSLGGLTLGIGMLVDNSIVVLESIDRQRQLGLSRKKAAIEGTLEVAAAVTASTLTTVAVFLPLVFVQGVSGQLFRDQALTVTFSLMASLAVALTVIPMLSGLGHEKTTAPATEQAGSGSADGAPAAAASGAEPVEMRLGAFERYYDRLLRGATRRPAMTLLIALVLFGVSIASVNRLGTQLLPSLTEGEFFFELKMPEGTSLAATDRQMKKMEAEARAQDAVGTIYSTVGSRLVAGGMSLNTKAENLAQLNVVLKNRGDDKAEAEVMSTLRQEYESAPGVEIHSGRPTYFSLQTPIEVYLFGEDLDELRDWSLRVASALSQIDGLVDVRSSLEAGSPEVEVIFDRDRVASLGLDLGELSQTLRDRIQGTVPTRFKEGDRQIDIRVRNLEQERHSVKDVRNLVLPGPDGEPIRLLTVAQVRLGTGPSEIHRVQQQRAAVISAGLKGQSLGGAVKAVKQVLAKVPSPAGTTVDMGGQEEEMARSFSSLRFALLLAIFLVYIVMAATFESFLHPFLVLFTIPLALVGVVAGLFATHTDVSVIVLIGVIMLVGIVVNNAIVLIDAINRRRRAGVEKRVAVIEAAHLRLRPILMTTITTILGLLPMALAFGEGSELRAPLAITVASGLALSTLLTLVVIPAAYTLVPSRIEPDESTEVSE
ncbi:MAG TPA: efflux RND transporter permease subunit [Candidatus Krumholzibacteria bacterium]|nr:efflux RND transporter permease subunit [Candidatus Krumholzibacteria bacterium]